VGKAGRGDAEACVLMGGGHRMITDDENDIEVLVADLRDDQCEKIDPLDDVGIKTAFEGCHMKPL